MSFLPFNLLGAVPDILMGRKPLDALLGNAAAVTTTLAAPGLLGAGGATPGISPGATAATQAAEQLPAQVINRSTQAGLLDKANYMTGNAFSQGGLLSDAQRVAKPAMTAYQVASDLQPEPEPMPVAPAPNFGGGNAVLQNLTTSQQQLDMQRQQMEMERRMQQRARIARMGGGYGIS